MPDLDNQLKKGILSIIVLKLIAERDMYGYEIIQLLDKNSDGYYKLKEGTLYPILYRLEDNELIESYRVISAEERKIPRKYYKITLKGRESLKHQIALWKLFDSTTNKILCI
ncbi:PadR family transcriptional regulator [Clostridium cavendishii]|uniref:PadR family transcriptional regulator n=1 Tax=Clostridium cavendishii TaxID=349931 RepID=UPI000933ECDD|nr:PadR family transcriptional regulator [Clostridium cavendishii]